MNSPNQDNKAGLTDQQQQWTPDSLANELANYWYEEQRYTANGRWQECKDEAKAAITTMLNEARVDELEQLPFQGGITRQGKEYRFVHEDDVNDRIVHLTGQQANEGRGE